MLEVLYASGLREANSAVLNDQVLVWSKVSSAFSERVTKNDWFLWVMPQEIGCNDIFSRRAQNFRIREALRSFRGDPDHP